MHRSIFYPVSSMVFLGGLWLASGCSSRPDAIGEDTHDDDDASGQGETGSDASMDDGHSDEGSGSDGRETSTPASEADRVSARCETLGDGVHAGETRLRRMTRTALGNTLRDLTGVPAAMAETVELDESIGPFFSNAIAPVTDLIVRQYAELATRVTTELAPRMEEIAGCPLGSDTTCADRFIRTFGLKAHRRPLDDQEIASYRAIYDAGASEGGPSQGFELVVETMLQSPFFLYHVEIDQVSASSTQAVRLDAYALASRLSYFLWNTMPDDALLQAAETGALLEPSALEAQVDRMLADPKAEDAIPSFHRQWLAIRNMEGVTKEGSEFPQFDAELRAAMLAELDAFSDYVVRRGDGTLATLLTADFSIIDEPLMELYGVTAPPGHVAGEPVPLDPQQRAGVLTQAAFLTKHAHPDQTSPVHRGLVIRENLICQTIPSPPPDVDNVAPAVNEATTTRERFAQHEADPVCASCHVRIDPIGLGFEHYDPIGAWRTHDGPAEVDASGEIISAGEDVEGEFDGAVELAHRLAMSEQVAACTVNQWFRFALGRIESHDDACTLSALYRGFETSGGNLRTLLKQIATSDAFTHVRVGEE